MMAMMANVCEYLARCLIISYSSIIFLQKSLPYKNDFCSCAILNTLNNIIKQIINITFNFHDHSLFLLPTRLTLSILLTINLKQNNISPILWN